MPVIYEITMRNNRYINHSFGGNGLIFIYKTGVTNLTVNFENNYFENITNNIADMAIVKVIA